LAWQGAFHVHRTKQLVPQNKTEMEHMMKRIILASLIALTTAGAVSAASAPTTLSSAAKAEAQNILPAASFDNLTADQAARIEGILTGGKDLTDTDVKLIITKALAS
jgi:hypothetical protein